MDSQSFGAYIRDLRLKNKMSLRKLAIVSESSSGYISNIERGARSTPHPRVILKLAKALRVPYEEMMLKAGYQRPDNVAVVELSELIKKTRNESQIIHLENYKDVVYCLDGEVISHEQMNAILLFLRASKQNKPE